MTQLAAPASTQAVDAWLDAWGGLEPGSLSDAEQAQLLRDLTRIGSRVAALKLRVLAAAGGAARRAGSSGPGAWAASLTNADPAVAHRQAGLGTDLEKHPATRQALSCGQLSPEHAEVILRADSQLPSGTSRQDRDRIEAKLVDKAETMSPSALRRAARRSIEAVESDPAVVDAHEDEVLRDEESRARAKTKLTLHDNGDGTVSGHFTVPTLHGDLLRKIIETITAPRRGHLGASEAQAGEGRTDWDHARGLALCELIEHLPTDHLHPRTAATLVVTIDQEWLRERLAAAGIDTGESISAGEARRLACGAGILPVVLDGRSQPLDLGRLKRLFNDTQRVAVGLLHATCAADGCERPYAWCELHHLDPWSSAGRTDLANAVPLCHFHHQRIHDHAYLHRRHADGSIRFARRT
ncbi:MAG: DUF222 domain-containing protein [Nocardioidaceae bacterium]